jgi:hypothetical protein
MRALNSVSEGSGVFFVSIKTLLCRCAAVFQTRVILKLIVEGPKLRVAVP